MRIGLFTDTFRPSINGIVFVIESTKRNLEALGHEVYVFCPGGSVRPDRQNGDDDEIIQDDHIIRFRSIKGIFYEDYDTSIFFPPRMTAKIRDLDLDIIHIFTPAQVGLLGVYAAFKNDIPIVAQHSTDVYEYAEYYPATLPGMLALAAMMPFSFKVRGKDVRELLKLYMPRRARVEWTHEIIEKTLTLLYGRCDAVIALSRKSARQLISWQKDEADEYKVSLLPNGVDALPAPSDSELAAFRRKWKLSKKDEIILFVGRLGAEKNLGVLIPMLELAVQTHPNAKLMFTGDFEYREKLESLAAESVVADRIIFTGMIPREKLGVVYAAGAVFVFPSLKDTQGWVLHEAAHAGLPIIIIDQDLSEVFKDGENGYFAENSASSLASKVVTVLCNKQDYQRMSDNSRQLAARLTERRSAELLEDIYKRISNKHLTNRLKTDD